MQIACVLRSGGDYAPKHVYALQKMCSKFMPAHDFFCLSDVELECDTIPLRHGWPGLRIADAVAIFGLIPLGIAVYAAVLWALRIEGRDELAVLVKKFRAKLADA